MKVLELDIETAPHLVYAWSLFDQTVSIDRVIKPGYTLCFAARWQGDSEKQFHSLWTDGEKRMVKAAWNLLNEADAVVHYNGKKFDIPTLQKDFVLADMPPPAPFQEIDLYQVVRRRFRFASNKLDFVCRELGLGNKVHHKGMALWNGVMSGNEEDQETMEEYNRHDLHLLAKLYNKLQPWVPNHPNRGLYMEDVTKPVCRACGSTHLKKNGLEKRWLQQYQRYVCRDCGANNRSRLSLGKTPAGVLV